MRLEETPASLVKVRAIEQLQDTLEEEAERKPPVIEKEQQEVVVLQSKRNTEDDWFLLLDVPTREASFTSPGTDSISKVYFACCFLLEHPLNLLSTVLGISRSGNKGS